ncbi:hypothetical protein [Pontibacter brevis]
MLIEFSILKLMLNRCFLQPLLLPAFYSLGATLRSLREVMNLMLLLLLQTFVPTTKLLMIAPEIQEARGSMKALFRLLPVFLIQKRKKSEAAAASATVKQPFPRL